MSTRALPRTLFFSLSTLEFRIRIGLRPRGVIAMSQPLVSITSPVLRGTTVWFTAYGFGWGYRAFAVPYQAIQEALDPDDIGDEQIRLAFESGRSDILQAVLQYELSPYDGERIRLSLKRPHADCRRDSEATTADRPGIGAPGVTTHNQVGA
jgi:hypothetical protein